MFTNIGGKIKGLAKFLCWVGIIISVILAIVFITTGNKASKELDNRRYNYSYNDYTVKEATTTLTTTGWVLLFVGPLASWISSFTLYGFGELIDRTASIDEKLAGKTTPADGGTAPAYNPNAAPAPAAGEKQEGI